MDVPSSDFVFENAQGGYHNITTWPVISMREIDALREHCALDPSDPDLAALDAALKFACDEGVFYDNSLSYICPGPAVTRFSPSRLYVNKLGAPLHEVTSNPKTWGFSAVEKLQEVAPILRKALRQVKPNLSYSQIKELSEKQRLLHLHARFDGGTFTRFEKCKKTISTLTIRGKQAERDLARTNSYVVYCENTKAYMGATDYAAALASARHFESQAAAQKYIDKMSRHNKNIQLAVVEVQTVVTKILSPLSATSKTLFDEALAHIRREEIEQALQQSNLDQLQKRVQELDPSATPTPTKPKRL